MSQIHTISRSVQYWIFIGVAMVFLQIVLGGITRLTDSGLSITEWEVIQGTLPPMNEQAWLEAFEKYKVAAKRQYEQLHADMSLGQFKVIYFWEYFHRLWARLMGFVFIIPFFIFLYQKKLPTWLLRRLGIVIVLASLAAIFGWIMVKSGLHDDTRTWVNAYNLVIHLIIATALFSYLFWTWLLCKYGRGYAKPNKQLVGIGWWIFGLLVTQMVFGGLMAGMRAGLIHPHFPFFIEGNRFLSALAETGWIDGETLTNYEPAVAIKAWVQVIHRALAYLLTIAIIWYVKKVVWSRQKNPVLRSAGFILLCTLAVQILLGILTIVNCIGRIPVIWGALHQAGAFLLTAALLYTMFRVGSLRGNPVEKV